MGKQKNKQKRKNRKIEVDHYKNAILNDLGLNTLPPKNNGLGNKAVGDLK